MTDFKDHFSVQSDIYLKFRPHYPEGLYAWLASLTGEHDLAWDCGTGNGQAAIGLTAFYYEVTATDPSEQQIRNAISHEQVTYLVEKAEKSSLISHTVDLVTVANALHWFDFEAFYKEVERVLKNKGIFAAWCYEVPSIDPEVDKILRRYHDVTLNDYWRPENRLVEKEYEGIPFPFEMIDSPGFSCERNMNLDDLIGYLNTWSATQRFITENNTNPTESVYNELLEVWQDPSVEKKLTWKLVLKVGRVKAIV